MRIRTSSTEKKNSRASETNGQWEERPEINRFCIFQARLSETKQQRVERRENDRVCTVWSSKRTLHTTEIKSLLHCTLWCSLRIYSLRPSVVIGKMDKIRGYCDALEFKIEAPRMYYAGEKIKLPKFHHFTASTIINVVFRRRKPIKTFPSPTYKNTIRVSKWQSKYRARKSHGDIQCTRAMNVSSCESLLPLSDVDYKFL